MVDSKYTDMKNSINSSYNDFVSNKSNIRQTLMKNIDGFKKVNFNGNDSVINNIKDSLNKQAGLYKKIEELVDQVLNKTDALYKAIKQALEDLDKLNKMYEDLLAHYPRVFRFGYDDDGHHSNSKNDAIKLWEQQKLKLENEIDELKKKIDLYKEQLETLNAAGIESLDDLTRKNSSFEFVPYEKLSEDKLKALNYREAVYAEATKLLNGKTSLEKLGDLLGYTKEQIMESLISKTTIWYGICGKIPSNIEQIIGLSKRELKDFGSDDCIRDDFNNDRFTVYSSKVKIDGKDFEIIQLFDNDKRSFLYDLQNYTFKANTINTIANYPENFFNKLADKKTRIVLGDDMTDATGLRNQGGNAFEDENTVFVRQRGETVHILNHELAHIFDYLGNGEHYSRNEVDFLKPIVDKEYSSLQFLHGESTYAYNDRTWIIDYFADSVALYIQYPDEVLEFAPETYNLYHDLLGDVPDTPRVIEDVEKIMNPEQTTDTKEKKHFTFGKGTRPDSNGLQHSDDTPDNSKETYTPAGTVPDNDPGKGAGTNTDTKTTPSSKLGMQEKEVTIYRYDRWGNKKAEIITVQVPISDTTTPGNNKLTDTTMDGKEAPKDEPANPEVTMTISSKPIGNTTSDDIAEEICTKPITYYTYDRWGNKIANTARVPIKPTGTVDFTTGGSSHELQIYLDDTLHGDVSDELAKAIINDLKNYNLDDGSTVYTKVDFMKKTSIIQLPNREIITIDISSAIGKNKK